MAIDGGTGLSTLLSGLKRCSSNITAITGSLEAAITASSRVLAVMRFYRKNVRHRGEG